MKETWRIVPVHHVDDNKHGIDSNVEDNEHGIGSNVDANEHGVGTIVTWRLHEG